jgi:tetratricopeptide (TPR) repeat protein
VPGTTAVPRALGFLADQALRDRTKGKSSLPTELHAGFDAVLSAFASYAKGDDEAARNALQAIGMQSPFLDWKLLLRGLIAYSTNDDARAIENWQRLTADRLPAMLAGPLRYQIDVSFRGTLKPEQARCLADLSDHMALPALSSLRKVQRLLSSPEHLPDALRKVRPLIGLLKMNSPGQFQRLASCFYWLIILGGQPDDMEEYEAVFGKPPDDPNFCRLIALVMESSGRLEEAHKEWKQYSDWIAGQPSRFPGEFSKRARAMIALRMGDNAIEHECADDEFTPQSFFDFLDRELNGRGKRKALKPSAEACYRNALELAPDWKEPHIRLLDLYSDLQLWPKAEAIGRRLVERFPDDSEALVDFSNVLHALGKDAEGLETLRTALKHNPLDATLRGVIAQLTLRRGRQQSAAGEFDPARESFRESLKLSPETLAPAARAALVACEFKAGCTDAARQLVSELNATTLPRAATAFLLLAEATRIKVAKGILTEFKTQFDESLKGELTVHELLQLLIVWSLYRADEDRYHGFGTLEKKIFAKVQQVVEGRLPGSDMIRLGIVLAEMRLPKPLKLLTDQGSARFADHSAFLFLQAQQLMLQRPKTFDNYRVGAILARVLEDIESKSEPFYAAMRNLIDRCCDEHPRLREIVERKRGMFPDFDPFD